MSRFFLRRLLAAFRRPPPGATETGAAPEAAPVETDMPEASGVLEIPITDVLDLHAFRPPDVASVVEEYLAEARARGLARVRIVHGKGIGAQRAIVRAILARHPEVASFGDAPDASGWGATVAILRPPGGDPESPPADAREGESPRRGA